MSLLRVQTRITQRSFGGLSIPSGSMGVDDREEAKGNRTWWRFAPSEAITGRRYRLELTQDLQNDRA